MKEIVLQMTLDKVTKNTVRYATPEGDGADVETIYVQKSAFETDDYPENIELVITEA
jgi:hypothetical protein